MFSIKHKIIVCLMVVLAVCAGSSISYSVHVSAATGSPSENSGTATSTSTTSSSTSCTSTNSSTVNGLCYSCSGPNCIPKQNDTTTCGANTGCDLVKTYVNPAISVLSALVGVAAVISLIVAGIQYSTSAGDPQKAAAARNRVLKTVVALIAYAFFYAFMQWLIPGGILNAGG